MTSCTVPAHHDYDGHVFRAGGVVALCACGEEFPGRTVDGTRELVDQHVAVVEQAAQQRPAPSSVRVILAHATGAGGVRETVAVGPLMTTEGVMTARHVLEQSGAECEVVSLASVAQWCRAHGWTELRAVQPAERAEAGR